MTHETRNTTSERHRFPVINDSISYDALRADAINFETNICLKKTD